MKKKLALTIIGIIALLGSTLYAQPIATQPTAEFVKILPTINTGEIKVLHAQESASPVTIKFITRAGEIGHDQISSNTYEKGFTKKYDVSSIKDEDYWVEVTSSTSSVTYHIVPNKSKKTFDAYLEKISYYHTVASNN